MADSRKASDPEADGTPKSSDGSGCEFVAGGSQWHPMKAAAIVGGAIAAGAGAYLGTRALARRNSGEDGRKLNSVMETAITATDLARKPRASSAAVPKTPSEPTVVHEPAIPVEPRF